MTKNIWDVVSSWKICLFAARMPEIVERAEQEKILSLLLWACVFFVNTALLVVVSHGWSEMLHVLQGSLHKGLNISSKPKRTELNYILIRKRKLS